MAQADPLGVLVGEIRAGLQVDGGTWPVAVRAGRRMEGDGAAQGDVPPLVIVQGNSRGRAQRVAEARWRITVVAYETEPRLAMLLDGRVSEIIHNLGPRHPAGKVAIYRSAEEIGGQPGEDPETRWSSVTSVYIVHATTATNV
jgi:hypothetical protein